MRARTTRVQNSKVVPATLCPLLCFSPLCERPPSHTSSLPPPPVPPSVHPQGTSIEPLYANETVSDPSPCHPELAESRDICMAATRNSPLSANSPQFVAFPVTAAHVQTCVRFAVTHKLCVAVLGTGHDFVNRHSCEGPSSILIRTTLLKDVAWDLRDARGLGSPAGSVRFGAGTTFSEAAKSAADHGRMVAQGWGITVGVAGWSLAGGHGPFGNALGLGVDNILAAEIVTADGELVVASSRTHPDLWWALRGGGGSTWGVAVSFTLRAHPLPAGGITSAINKARRRHVPRCRHRRRGCRHGESAQRHGGPSSCVAALVVQELFRAGVLHPDRIDRIDAPGRVRGQMDRHC